MIDEIFMPNTTNPLLAALKHSALWIKSGNKEITIENPNFDIEYKKGYVIYCIHGTADRNASFTHFVDNILSKLPDFISSMKLVSFENRAKGESIESFSRQLKAIINKNGDENVILIGHSRGGLIASHYTENHAKKNNINTHLVTTICSPFNGAYPIYWPFAAVSKSVKQMMKASEFLQELNEQVIHSETPYAYIGAAADKIILKDAHLPSPECDNVLYLENEGHLSAISAQETGDFFLKHLNMIPKPDKPLADDDIPVLSTQIQESLKNLRFHADKLPEANAQKLSQFDLEGSKKHTAIEELLSDIETAKDNLEEIQTIVNNALRSEYKKGFQTNHMLVNRGTHLYWIHSIFKAKVNKVSHRLSRSTTEDLLIELKNAIDSELENISLDDIKNTNSSSND